MDNQKVSAERIEKLIKELKKDSMASGLYLIGITSEERRALSIVIVEREDVKLVAKVLDFNTRASKEEKLTPEEEGQLKQVILKTRDTDVACSALLNLSDVFTKDELPILRKLAYTTNNEYWAYHIYRNDCMALIREPAARASLRRVIMNTKNPERAFEFLRVQEEMREPYKDYAQSLEYTDADVDHFKQVVISSSDPQWSYYLLRTGETKDPDDFTREGEGPVELTPKERATLKRSIIESQSPEWAFETLRHISDLTQGERMVLKGIFMRIKKPSLACFALCDTDFISILTENERDYLRKLAAQVKEPYNAREALKYIYDLTPEERAALEKVSQKK